MKKIFLLLASIAIVAACSKSEDENPAAPGEANGVNEPGGEGGLVFEINAGASNSLTKAAIYSEQQPALHVTRVTVHAFYDEDTTGNYVFVKTFTIPSWSDGIAFRRYTVPDEETLPDGLYRFLAVGRNTSDLYTLTPLVENTTKFEDFQASVTNIGDEADIYSGYSEVSIVDGARVSIDMRRKVAGVIGYFTNVPHTIGTQTVRYLRLSINKVNKAVRLGDGAGVPVAEAAYDIMNIDLSTQNVENGVYSGNDLSAQNVTKLPNSQLSGMYLMPVSSVTLTLGLYEEDNTPVKTWEVRMNGATSFHLEANSLYTLGQKVQATSTDNGTPDPNDDDEGVNLLNDKVIAISISPAWEVVNELVIQ